jgi:hypothetical protein
MYTAGSVFLQLKNKWKIIYYKKQTYNKKKKMFKKNISKNENVLPLVNLQFPFFRHLKWRLLIIVRRKNVLQPLHETASERKTNSFGTFI